MIGLYNLFLYVTGIGFLSLAKVKHRLSGYSSPKPFTIAEVEKCVDYDINVVEHWISILNQYTKGTVLLGGKSVLELGPGSDIGVGLYLLSKGVSQYNAIDVNNLVESVPDSFYESLLETINKRNNGADIGWLRDEVKKTRCGENDKLNYVCDKGFDLCAAFEKDSIDIVFSQAAFEHFEDPERTLKQLSSVVKPGGVIVSEVDLRTHSRWIRDKDPNNIYRYSRSLYDLFRFPGSPNRIRPYKYKQFLNDNGWKNLWVKPLWSLSDIQFSKIRSHLYKKFQNDNSEMSVLSLIICATKS